MSNLTSVLEKFKLIEKVTPESSIDTVDSQESETAADNVSLENSSSPVHSFIPEPNLNKNPESEENNKSKVDKMDKVLQINEIYSKFKIENSSLNTIFMVDNFIKALPENLPSEIKRQSVMGIVSASGVNLNTLLKDGQNRIGSLDEFIKDYSTNTSEDIKQYKFEIEKLSQTIEEYKNSIRKKEKLLEEQYSIVEYENQKIQSILDFMKG